jgi:hypothetical protein
MDFKNYNLHFHVKRNGGTKIMNSFIERHADSIICEPSGLTYNELKDSKIQKMILVGTEQ